MHLTPNFVATQLDAKQWEIRSTRRDLIYARVVWFATEWSVQFTVGDIPTYALAEILTLALRIEASE